MPYGLSEQDVHTLRDLIAWKRSQVVNTQQRPRVEPQIESSTDIYIAQAPEQPGSGTGTDVEGIPPMVGASPGMAICTIFQLFEGVLQPLSGGLQVPVYNLGPKIDNGTYFPVGKDKAGQWYVLGWPNGGGGGGCDSTITVVTGIGTLAFDTTTCALTGSLATGTACAP